MKTSALPKPSTLESFSDVPDLHRDEKSHVMVSAGGRDRGPVVGVRLVHETQEAEIQYEQDKHRLRVRQIVDPLRDLHRNKAIDDDLFVAGLRFQEDFDNARFASAAGMRFDGLPASGRIASDDGRTDAIADARREVKRALGALGGESSTSGKVLCQCVGLRKSLRELVRDETGKTPKETKEKAKRAAYTRDVFKGALIAALEILEGYYQNLGYIPRRATRK